MRGGRLGAFFMAIMLMMVMVSFVRCETEAGLDSEPVEMDLNQDSGLLEETEGDMKIEELGGDLGKDFNWDELVDDETGEGFITPEEKLILEDPNSSEEQKAAIFEKIQKSMTEMLESLQGLGGDL